MTRSVVRLAALTCAVATLAACSTPTSGPSPATTTAATSAGADPAVPAAPGSTATASTPTTWAQPTPTGSGSSSSRESSWPSGTPSGGSVSAPSARTAAVTTSVTADLKLPVDLMSLRQMTLVRSAGLTVVVGGRSAQAFTDDGHVAWTTPLGGMLEIGQAVAVGGRVVTGSSPAAGNGKLLVQVLDAATGKVVVDVPVAGDAIDLEPASIDGKDVVVAVTDSGRPGGRAAFAMDASGRRVWSKDLPERVRRVDVSGTTAALTRLPEWAPDNTLLDDGSVTFIDVRTGATRSRAAVAPTVLEEPVVRAGDGWWVPTGESHWTRFTAAGERTPDQVSTSVRGGGVHTFTWRTGWAAVGKPAARLSPSATVLADTRDVTLWFDSASPYPVTAVTPKDGKVVGGLVAPAGLNVSESPFGMAVVGADVFALTCTPVQPGAQACSAFSVTRWPLL